MGGTSSGIHTVHLDSETGVRNMRRTTCYEWKMVGLIFYVSDGEYTFSVKRRNGVIHIEPSEEVITGTKRKIRFDRLFVGIVACNPEAYALGDNYVAHGPETDDPVVYFSEFAGVKIVLTGPAYVPPPLKL